MLEARACEPNPPLPFLERTAYMGCKYERLVHFLPRYEHLLTTFSCLVGETAPGKNKQKADWESIMLHWSMVVPLHSATRELQGP